MPVCCLQAKSCEAVRGSTDNYPKLLEACRFSVTPTLLKIGDEHGGGIIVYIDGSGLNGLIASKADEPCGNKYSWKVAKKVCKELVENGYNDWRLPSKDELNILYFNKSVVGGFADNLYWSSSEYDVNYAWYQGFCKGLKNLSSKTLRWRVRAVRTF